MSKDAGNSIEDRSRVFFAVVYLPVPSPTCLYHAAENDTRILRFSSLDKFQVAQWYYHSKICTRSLLSQYGCFLPCILVPLESFAI